MIWSRTRKVRLAVAVILAVVGVPTAGIGAWVLSLEWLGNVHVVEPARLYRAAQLNGAALDEVLDRYATRTIVNLRGENEGKGWYDDEVAVARKHKLVHIDVSMSAMQEPDDATVTSLIHALRDSPSPILVHCEGGSDRSGLASALYELLVAGRTPAVAAEQLSIRYGHFPWLGSHTVAMDRAFDRIAAEVRQASALPAPFGVSASLRRNE
jgi:protein tyrosine/serine phosphatase